MLAPRGVPPKPQNKEKRSKKQGFLGFKPGFDTAAPRSLDSRWNFPDWSRLGPFQIRGHPPGHFSPKSPPIFRYLGPPMAPPPPPAALPRNSLPGEVLKTPFGPLRVPIDPKTMFLEGPWSPANLGILEIQDFGDPESSDFFFRRFSTWYLHISPKS